MSIGSLYPGMRALVLDDDDAPLPPGETGELVINSPTHMVGYWNQPELTAQATYTTTSPDGTRERWHRTGDLVAAGDDGLFRFFGRKDRMVKTRGHRVELDEVETALSTHPAVEQAVVFAVPDDEGSQQIMAVVVPAPGVAESGELDEATLTRHVGRRLPRYAVPRSVRIADTVPRTSSGKPDRVKLSAEAVQAGVANRA